MSAGVVTGNRAVKIVGKQTLNGTIIQRKVTILCTNKKQKNQVPNT
jgi:hypothetical protein